MHRDIVLPLIGSKATKKNCERLLLGCSIVILSSKKFTVGINIFRPSIENCKPLVFEVMHTTTYTATLCLLLPKLGVSTF